MAHRVGYYYRSDKDILVLVWRLADWSGRNLVAKGIRANDFVIARDMTQVEIDDYVTGHSRLVFTEYAKFCSSILAFKIDEQTCGVGEIFTQSVLNSLPARAQHRMKTDAAIASVQPS